jgi:hypothetical protein
MVGSTVWIPTLQFEGEVTMTVLLHPARLRVSDGKNCLCTLGIGLVIGTEHHRDTDRFFLRILLHFPRVCLHITIPLLSLLSYLVILFYNFYHVISCVPHPPCSGLCNRQCGRRKAEHGPHGGLQKMG